MPRHRAARRTRLEWIVMVQSSPDSMPHERSHPWHELICPLTDGYCCRVGKRELKVAPGEVLCHLAGHEHRPTYELDLRTRFWVLAWRDGLCRYGPERQLLVRDIQGRIAASLRWLFEVSDSKAAWGPVLRRALLTAVLCEHRRLSLGASDCLSDRVRGYILHDLHRPLNLEELGRSENLSARQLLRRFRAETGTTPGRCLREARVEAAVNWLLAADAGLKEVARRVGLSSTSYLSTCSRSRPAADHLTSSPSGPRAVNGLRETTAAGSRGNAQAARRKHSRLHPVRFALRPLATLITARATTAGRRSSRLTSGLQGLSVHRTSPLAHQAGLYLPDFA